jgi:hypothetical protein
VEQRDRSTLAAHEVAQSDAITLEDQLDSMLWM